jgi:hypothetical protein
MTRMKWESARIQARAGRRTGNGGNVEHIRTPARRITATGRRSVVEGRALEYGLSADWPDDIAPNIRPYFRWGATCWCPVEIALSVAGNCGDEPELPVEQLDRMSDREWLRRTVWKPRPLPPQSDVPGFTWWVEPDGQNRPRLAVVPAIGKRGARLPFSVVGSVLRDVATWSELQLYATSILRSVGTTFPISQVGRDLRENDGHPRWSDEPEQAIFEEMDYVGVPLSRVVGTGRKSRVQGHIFEYGLSVRWRDDFRPCVITYFRWGESGWCPTESALEALAACTEEPDLPEEELAVMSDEEVHRGFRFIPRAIPREADENGFQWWVEEQGKKFRVRVESAGGKELADVPLEVARLLDRDIATFSDLAQYADAVLRANGIGLSISRVGAALRENHGRPLRKRRPSEVRRSGRPAAIPNGQKRSGSGAP